MAQRTNAVRHGDPRQGGRLLERLFACTRTTHERSQAKGQNMRCPIHMPQAGYVHGCYLWRWRITIFAWGIALFIDKSQPIPWVAV
ncbi:hypothetical protein D3C86_1420730 [compost metagenome]